MDNTIIDSAGLFENEEESKRLSYKMLFNDTTYQNGNGHSKNGRNGHSKHGEENLELQKEHEKELEQLEQKWQQKLEKAKEEVYQQGLKEGKKQGKEDALESMEQQLSTFKDAVASADNRISHLLDDLQPYIATMVFNIAEKVIGLPLKSEYLKEKVANEIRQILASVEQGVSAKVTVAATDYGFIVRTLKGLLNCENIEISSSESLNSGEYSVDTPNERVVKNFKKMLKDFREKVALENEAGLEGDE